MMEQAGKSMNLRGHLVSGQFIYGPGDIEVHQGEVSLTLYRDEANAFRILFATKKENLSTYITSLISDVFFHQVQ